MDFGNYLLQRVVDATTPPNETPEAAKDRREAIVEMVRAYDPQDSYQGTIACHCVELQFLCNAAMRDANAANLEPALAIKVRASAMTASRTLYRWVSNLEKAKKRNEPRLALAREVALRKAARAEAAAQAAELAEAAETVRQRASAAQSAGSAEARPAARAPVPKETPVSGAALAEALASAAVNGAQRGQPVQPPSVGDRRMSLYPGTTGRADSG